VSGADPSGLDPTPSGHGHPRREGRTYFAEGAPDAIIAPERANALVYGLLAALGPLRRVLLLPPDATRRHSGAGELTALLYRRLAPTAEVQVLPALGTHAPMHDDELAAMFPGIPRDRCHVHSFRDGVVSLGEVPAAFVREVSGGRVDTPIRCEVARQLVEGRWDRILSVGQLVPHEVAGIAGHDKNVYVGAGGKDAIDRTHFLGAVTGIEATLGRADTPVRAVLAYMAAVLGRELPVTHLMTARGPGRAPWCREACSRATGTTASPPARRWRGRATSRPLGRRSPRWWRTSTRASTARPGSATRPSTGPAWRSRTAASSSSSPRGSRASARTPGSIG